VLAFSWPTAIVRPKDVPIAIGGPSATLAPVEKALDEQGDGAFKLVEVTDRAAAVPKIKTRDVYGGVILGTKTGAWRRCSPTESWAVSRRRHHAGLVRLPRRRLLRPRLTPPRATPRRGGTIEIWLRATTSRVRQF
jgi:hypothetical protein